MSLLAFLVMEALTPATSQNSQKDMHLLFHGQLNVLKLGRETEH